jgi:hypothetical protein
MLAERRVDSPEAYTYHCTYFGRPINPVLLNKIWRVHMKQAYINQLEQACKATGSVAISSVILSRHEKEQHKHKRYTCGRQVYYLFPADAVPLPIYCKLDAQDGQLIYPKGDEEE